MGYVVDVVANAATAGTNHFASIRFEPFGSGGAYESLRSRKETREEGQDGEGGDLSISLDGGFTEDGETRQRVISGFELG